MRIAHIEAGRHLYGGAAQVLYLIKSLASRGVESSLLCPRGSEIAAAAPAETVREMPLRGELDIGMVRRLKRELERLRPDVVHVHSRRGADLYGGLAAALAGIPAVLTRRVDAHEPAWLGRAKFRPYRAIVALSGAIEQQLLEAGVVPERIVRIASGVDTQRYRPQVGARDRLRLELGLPADALVLGVAAQLIERKRHSWLFALLPELVREWPRLRVLCFGRGPLEARLRAEIDARGLTGQVMLGGFRDDWAELLPGLDVLVHPAEREGLGLALLEAASAGVPVVACSVGGVPDVVVDGETGLLVPRDDASGFSQALGTLLVSPEARARLGAAARRHAERRFGVARLAAAHLALYERVLGVPVGERMRSATS